MVGTPTRAVSPPPRRDVSPAPSSSSSSSSSASASASSFSTVHPFPPSAYAKEYSANSDTTAPPNIAARSTQAKPVIRMATGEIPLQFQSKSSFGGMVRSMTSFFGFPSGFFQSQANIRTWGEKDLCDPSVQPFPPPPPPPAKLNVTYPFKNTIPGYPNEKLEHFLINMQNNSNYQSVAGTHTKFRLGPNLTTPSLNLNFTPSKYFKPQPVGYDWQEIPNYKLDSIPYVNAFMSPKDPWQMYGPANPFVAYPYGVPAVEENEKSDNEIIKKNNWGCC